MKTSSISSDGIFESFDNRPFDLKKPTLVLDEYAWK